MVLQLLVDLPPPAHHLGEGFGGNRLGQFGVGPKAADATEDGGFDRLRRHGLGFAVLPALLLRAVTDVIAVAFGVAHRVRVDHRRPAGNAEQEALQQGAELVLQAGPVVAIVPTKLLVYPIPPVLIDDSLVLARVQGALMLDHSGVDDVGEDAVHRSLCNALAAPDLAILCGPRLCP